jgi:hypothetical protein
MGLRCIKIYLNDEIPEERVILEAWDSCPTKRRSALGRSWLLGSYPKPSLSSPRPPNVVNFKPPQADADDLKKASDNFTNTFG